MTRAFTVGFAEVYERTVRIPGNAKAPGGYAFETYLDALDYRDRHSEFAKYGVYEMELPGTFEECTTGAFWQAAWARHNWHRTHREVRTAHMGACAVCSPRSVQELDCRLLVVEAPFINPDTDSVVAGSIGTSLPSR